MRAFLIPLVSQAGQLKMAIVQAYPPPMNQLPNRSTSHVELMVTTPGKLVYTGMDRYVSIPTYYL